jgi:YidC/Oxa1 family membrane protein insertase
MLDFLFQTIIYPIKLSIEIIYMLFDWVFKGNAGIAITGVSVAVSLGCLPLYAKAERLQDKEREIQKKMAARVASIKRHFKGDEQYMILSTYYRQNHYHPVYALRSSLSLLVQIPFFIAAYSFLSHLSALSGESLWVIKDLAKEDGLLRIGVFALNALPILMTLINIVSGMIYTKGFPLKEKIQLYAMALVFLALLYHSPSALVLYWTLNNVFSLVKNVVFKMKNPARFLYLATCSALLAFCVYVVLFRHHSRSYRLRNISLSLAVSAMIAAIPLYVALAKAAARKFFRPLWTDGRARLAFFMLSAIALWLILGVYIPFNLAASSPFEFSFVGTHKSPFSLLFYPASQAAGFILVWPLYVYCLFPERVKSLLTLAMGAALVVAVVNVFVMNVPGGTVSQTLQFIDGAVYRVKPYYLAINVLATALLTFSILALVSLGRIGSVSVAIGIIAVSTAGISAYKASVIGSGYARYSAIRAEETSVSPDGTAGPVFSLSRSGKNVFIVMLDKAIGSYFPLVLKESPELASAFAGFTYYPNTLSYGQKTIIGAPPLFGGYEYTPSAMNKRDGTRMVEKHNESLLVMPTLFKENGYKATITDAPFVNYQWVADNAIFRERGIEARNLIGNYSSRYMAEKLPFMRDFGADAILKRNFLIYSALAALPVPFKDAIYNGGKYWNSALLSINTLTLDSYAVLHYLPELTDANGKGNTFTIMVNDLTHEASFLQHPDYSFGPNIDPSKDVILGKSDTYDYYHVNAASVRLLAAWLDELKKLGVYGNTRIIIVSDHGSNVDQPGFDSFQRDVVTAYNPLLLVKDFDDNGPLRTDGSFMTNADVPAIAGRGIIQDPKNPFTGNELSENEKKDGVMIVRRVTLHQGYSLDLMTTKTCYKSGAPAWLVTGDIMKRQNWIDAKAE